MRKLVHPEREQFEKAALTHEETPMACPTINTLSQEREQLCTGFQKARERGGDQEQHGE